MIHRDGYVSRLQLITFLTSHGSDTEAGRRRTIEHDCYEPFAAEFFVANGALYARTESQTVSMETVTYHICGLVVDSTNYQHRRQTDNSVYMRLVTW